jgi:hypothetical protein
MQLQLLSLCLICISNLLMSALALLLQPAMALKTGFAPAKQALVQKLTTNELYQRRCAAYNAGGITANDLLKSLELVASSTRANLPDVVELAIATNVQAAQRQKQLTAALQARSRNTGYAQAGASSLATMIGQQYQIAQGTSVVSSRKSRVVDCCSVAAPATTLKAKLIGRSGAAACKREAEVFRSLSDSKNFVQLIDYLPDYNSKGDSALIFEAGLGGDLLALANRGPVRGEELRRIAATAAAAAHKLHSKGLVWVDLCLANFVLMQSNGGSSRIKGIDLESAVPAGSPCQDYRPQVNLLLVLYCTTPCYAVWHVVSNINTLLLCHFKALLSPR